MILRAGHGQNGVRICESQHGNLWPLQKLLDDDSVARRAKGLIQHDLPHSLLGLLPGFADQHAFAQRQAICLDDQRNFCRFDILQRLLCVRKSLILRCGDVVFLHQLFGERLAGLDNGRIFLWPKSPDALFFQRIHHAHGQRIIRRHYHQIHLLPLRKSHHIFNIRRRNIHTSCDLRNAAIARRTI